MLLLLVLTRLAWAAPPTLDPAGARRLAEARFDQGPLSVQVGAAVVLPVVQDGRTIGVGFVGPGALTLSFPDPADALRFANLQVLLGGRAADELRALAHGEEPFSTPVSQGFVFGDASVLEPWLGGEPADPGEAVRSLSGRLEVLAQATSLDDGAVEEVGADQWVFADFLGGERLWYVREDKAGALEDRWLSLLRDDLHGWPAPDVLSIGRSAAGEVETHTVALGRWEESPSLGNPSIRLGLQTTSAEVEVRASAPDAQGRVSVAVVSTLDLLAHEDRGTLDLLLPRVADLDRAWSVTGVERDGRPLPLPDDPGPHLRLPLDPPLQAGQAARVVIAWQDRWELADRDARDPNLASTPTGILPRVGGDPTMVRVRVGLPAGSSLVPAVSGTTEREWEEGGLTWVQARQDGRFGAPRVALGRWSSLAEPGVAGLPAVRVHLFPGEHRSLDRIPAFVRTVVDYDQRLLPPLPWDELELIQLRDRAFAFTWTSSAGLITLRKMQSDGEGALRSRLAHLEELVMAHEIAHQWWGALVRPARAEDRWLSETLAEVQACLFMGAAFGPERCTELQQGWRERWEDGAAARRGVSLRDASGTAAWHDAAYAYGPYILGHMLRGRLGDDAFLGGLDAFATDRAGQPATVDRLQAVLEARSGQDLSAFFAWWTVGGFIPRLELVVEGTEGTVRSDVPFGTLEVPVVAMTGEGKQELRVEVVDGIGHFRLPSKPSQVLLDPHGMVLARSRKVSLR